MDEWILTPKSSHVAALSWEEEGIIPTLAGPVAYGRLWVAFKNNKIYWYEGISQDDYSTIKSAVSIGGALHRLGITNPRGRRAAYVGEVKPGDELPKGGVG